MQNIKSCRKTNRFSMTLIIFLANRSAWRRQQIILKQDELFDSARLTPTNRKKADSTVTKSDSITKVKGMANNDMIIIR